MARVDEHDQVYRTAREKYDAIIQEISAAHDKGQPVLVGTVSIENSERLSKLLQRRKIKHVVLNAKYHQQEAEIIAQALGPPRVDEEPSLAPLDPVEPVRAALHKRYRTFQALLGVPTTEFEQVEGIGRSRAEQLRSYFDRLGEIGTALEIGDSAGG